MLFYCLAFGTSWSALQMIFVFYMRPADIGGIGKSV